MGDSRVVSGAKKKSILLSLRLSPAQLKDVRALSAALGLNPQSFLRMLIQKAKGEQSGALRGGANQREGKLAADGKGETGR